jgi:hypothetical protein
LASRRGFYYPELFGGKDFLVKLLYLTDSVPLHAGVHSQSPQHNEGSFTPWHILWKAEALNEASFVHYVGGQLPEEVILGGGWRDKPRRKTSSKNLVYNESKSFPQRNFQLRRLRTSGWWIRGFFSLFLEFFLFKRDIKSLILVDLFHTLPLFR